MKYLMKALKSRTLKILVLLLICVIVLRVNYEESDCPGVWFGADRGPYLQNMSSTTMVIKWRYRGNDIARVRYGVSPDELSEKVEKDSDSSDHEILLKNLIPDTRYYYQVNDSTETVFSFRTPPVEGEAKPTRVWVLGDSGTADSNAIDVKNAFEKFNGGSATDLVLMLGDNAYDDGADCEYQKAFFDIYPLTIAETPVMPTIGNHDARTDGAAPYRKIFTLPRDGKTGVVPSGTESYYSFNYSNIHFVSLDSETSNRSPGGAMHSWLMADLAANTQDWTIVYFHHPPYSKGNHDSDKAGALSDMREHYTAIFEQYGVDLVFAGHSHGYERSFPIKGHRGTSDTFLQSMKTDTGDGRKDGDGEYSKPYHSVDQGVIYTVAGSSGKTRPAPYNHPVHYLSMSKLGSVVLDFNGDEVNVTFVSPDPEAIDHFTLVKTN